MKKVFYSFLLLPLLLSGCKKQSKPITPGPDIPDVPTVVNTYNGYYSSLLSWENGEDLKNQLHTIISGGTYKALSYKDFEENKVVDRTQYDFEKVDVIYNEEDCDSSRTGNGWQREHCFPASLMTGSVTGNAVKFLGRATDYHNLWAGDGSANSSRSNKTYGNADKESETYVSRNSIDGTDGYSYDSQVFEPARKDKGLCARSIFYMVTMYNETVRDEVNGIDMLPLSIEEGHVTSGTGSSCTFSIGHLEDLLEWSKLPVMVQEAQHNELVYSHVYVSDGYAQGNRNPYVDFPELVDYAFGSKKNEAGMLCKLTASITSLRRETANEVAGYAIETAKRTYKYGETFSKNDYKVVEVNNDFTYKTYTNTQCELDGYVFGAEDGISKTIKINVENKILSYDVSLDVSGNLSNSNSITKTGISTSKVGEDQQIKIGEDDWLINVEAPGDFYMANNNKIGGLKFGSGTKPVEKITLTTVNDFTVNAIFIQTIVGNKNSVFNLTIKVGTEEILTTKVEYSDSEYISYGKNLATSKTGKLTYIITNASTNLTDSNSVLINKISFNIVK